MDRKKRVKHLKIIIALLLCLAAVIPMGGSLWMLHRVGGMEKRLAALRAEQQAKEETRHTASSDPSRTTQAQAVSSDAGDTVAPGKRVYLTFDDGPTHNTGKILDILEEEKVKATFFVVGNENSYALDAMRRIVWDGHSIGIHSYTHDYDQVYGSMKAFKKDVRKTGDLIYRATRIRTRLYRFPGGSTHEMGESRTDDEIRWLNSQGYVYFDWNAMNMDAVAQVLSQDQLIKNAMDNIHANTRHDNNSVLLMHDLETRPNTVKSLPKLIETLKSEGYVMDKPLTPDVPPVQQRTLEGTTY